MRFSFNTLLVSALSALVLSPSLHAEELEPPNVSIYADVMFSMAQTKRLTFNSDDGVGQYHHGDTDGYRARLGIRLNDLSHGFWSYGIEGSLVQLANDDESISYTRDPKNHLESQTDIHSVNVDGEHSLELSGFEFAGRLWYDDTLYLRAGAMVYNEKTRLRETRTFFDSNGDEIYNPTTRSDADTKRGFAPMVGVGIQYPIVDDIYVAAEYNVYRMNSKQVDTLAAGVRLVF